LGVFQLCRGYHDGVRLEDLWDAVFVVRLLVSAKDDEGVAFQRGMGVEDEINLLSRN
jgi:hypothetical protein